MVASIAATLRLESTVPRGCVVKPATCGVAIDSPAMLLVLELIL